MGPDDGRPYTRDDEDEGGEAPCMAHLFEDPDDAPTRPLADPSPETGAADAADAADAAAVDGYLAGVLRPEDPTLAAARQATADGGLPAIEVSTLQGKLLILLARLVGAHRILEVGTLGGYSAVCLARGLTDGGLLLTLEVSEHHAGVARANLTAAGVDGRVQVVVGPALASMDALIADGVEPFDLVFIDADKPNNPGYLERALALTRPGSLIVVDNVVRRGRVADPADDGPDVIGTRAMLEAMGSDPRLDATAIQTVGAKGWDGLAVALVR